MVVFNDELYVFGGTPRRSVEKLEGKAWIAQKDLTNAFERGGIVVV